MKSFKLIMASLLLAAAFAAQASAQTVVRITGSTAYRGATHTAVTKILAPGFTYGYVGTTLSGAGAAIFTGNVGNTSVIIKTSWSGSVGGVQTVSNSLPVKFLPNDTAQSAGGTGGAANPNTSGNPSESSIPDIAMSDTFQSSTVFNTTALIDQIVGVVPFKWVASNGAPGNLTNVTPQLAQNLWQNGSISLALFTGQNPDEGVKVYATGRDPDSGTRLTAFAESGIGVNAVVAQYKPTISNSTVTGYQPYPQQTVNGIVFPVGQGGEASGGTLATNMGASTTASTGYSVTYLSTGDAATAIAAGAKELQYNGVTYSLPVLQEGLYTFWGYEHLMYRQTLSGATKTVADTLANQIKTTDATVLLSSMHVTRPTDGGLVTQNY